MNARAGNPDKHFFTAPRSEERRRLWINAIGKQFSINTKFIVCEDHFDVSESILTLLNRSYFFQLFRRGTTLSFTGVTVFLYL